MDKLFNFLVSIWMFVCDAWTISVAFVKRYWVSLVLVGIAIVQIFIGKWWILAIMIIVAAALILVDKLRNK